MMIRTSAVIILLALTLAGGPAAAGISLPESGALPGWDRQGPQRLFIAADLYGHINGGAELFLELGFVELLVQAYQQGEQEVALEVYRMESPEAALAIYLFKCGEETPWPEIETRNSSTRFQAVLLRGNCLVLVNSFSGDRALRPAMAGLARRLLASISAAGPAGDPFARLPATGRVSGSERLIRGEYSLQSLYTLGQGDMLQLGGKLFAAAAEYHSGGETAETRIAVLYPDPGRAGMVFAHLRTALDPALTLLRRSDEQLVFRDWKGQFGQITLDGPALEVRVNLAKCPP